MSVGFIPHSLEYDDDTPVLKGNELLEVSCVPIPANANALALALKDGSLNTKDAQRMLRSMRDGAATLEEQRKNSPADGEEKNAEELNTQLNSMTELVTSFGEQSTTVSTTVDTMNTELTEVKGAIAELKSAETQRPIPKITSKVEAASQRI